MTGKTFDVAIVGSGVSGSFFAKELTDAGLDCLMIEAGTFFKKGAYPTNEMDANSRLYWSGGIEVNKSVDLAFLRPKVVGGGSIVNQALMDRFDESAFSGFRRDSGIDFFKPEEMAPWYDKVESELSIQEIPEKYWNDNVRIFRDGFDKNGFKWARLKRAQKDCRYEDGTDCIECLAGCPLDSKQSMPVTVLAKALENGLSLISECQVDEIRAEARPIQLNARQRDGQKQRFHARALVLAAGAIGNTVILQKSGLHHKLPGIGKGFYSHPQEMVFGLYDREIDAFKQGFQALKSDDPKFRQQGFKLENVFAPPVSLAMLLKQTGDAHQRIMRKVRNLACVEVAVRDTNPGTITVNRRGHPVIDKALNDEDRRRRQLGLEAIEKIFTVTGAETTMNGQISIGLHLMGGCAIGKDPTLSVVGPDFRMHGYKDIFMADSSTFPNAPGQNPSLTIMALSVKAAEEVKGHVAKRL